jgi:hypothetical protein
LAVCRRAEGAIGTSALFGGTTAHNLLNTAVFWQDGSNHMRRDQGMMW